MAQKKFEIGIDFNISKTISNYGNAGSELLNSLHLDGDVVQKIPKWQATISRENDWNESEVEQVKELLKSQFVQKFGSLLPENCEFFVREAKGD